MRSLALLAAASIVALAAAGCDDDAPAGPTPSSTGEPRSLAPGTLPTSSPGAATGTVTSGSATIELDGDLSGRVRLQTLGPPALYSAPPGSIGVVWTDGRQSMGITGPSFEGQRTTSNTLTLRLEIRNGPEAAVLTSAAGECTLTVDTAVASSLAGTFACADLAAPTATGDALSVDATGTFTASG
jgi:hypothetical protein